MTGNAGSDLMQGDNGLLTRKTPLATGQWTFESTAITAGDDDTLIGDTLADPSIGRDIMIGGIGNDTFSLSIGDDIVAGEFLRVRFKPHGDGTDRVTSFLTPAVRDLDLLVQITLSVNLSSKSSVIVGPPEGINIELGFATDSNLAVLDRMDLLFLEDGLFGSAMMEGLFAGAGPNSVAGMQGFRLQSPDLVVGGGDIQTITDEAGEQTPAEPDGEAPAEREVQQGAALDEPEAEFGMTPFDLDAESSLSGWRMAGWRIGSS